MIPVGDDNSDRRSRPVITWVLIDINILVFVFPQGLGTNERVIDSCSTVPGEILPGKDIVTRDRVVVDPATGLRYLEPGLGAFITVKLWAAGRAPERRQSRQRRDW